jgi:hypothetical protein
MGMKILIQGSTGSPAEAWSSWGLLRVSHAVLVNTTYCVCVYAWLRTKHVSQRPLETAKAVLCLNH